MIEKVCVKCSKCKCVLPKLSHRGRALVVNNLVASMIWHRMIVLNSPNNIVSDIQRNVIKKNVSGYQWTKAAVLFLPVKEGGHGLMDIQSRIMTFRIQAVQRLLYSG